MILSVLPFVWRRVGAGGGGGEAEGRGGGRFWNFLVCECIFFFAPAHMCSLSVNNKLSSLFCFRGTRYVRQGGFFSLKYFFLT